jgi:hypothetical protein
MRIPMAFRCGLALIVGALGVLACDANSFINLINNNNPSGQPVIEVVGTPPTPAPPPAVMPCLAAFSSGNIYVCTFIAEFKQSAKSTFYTVNAMDAAPGGSLTFHWSNTNSCGKFIPGSPPLAETAEWHHPDSPDGDCLQQAVHPGIISVDITSSAGGTVTCKYDDGSASGKADPFTDNAAFHCAAH